uniref:Chemosensory protein 8 n=1 Tax=Chouioia cunea TaxID=1570515 RepID=A0A6B9CPL7_9HYME|nr:chemosensory protein 8 [Chouioia cunea]
MLVPSRDYYQSSCLRVVGDVQEDRSNSLARSSSRYSRRNIVIFGTIF